MSIDTVGGVFVGNRSTKRYMYIIIDHFTRYVWIRTSKNQTANEFVKLLQPIIQQNEVDLSKMFLNYCSLFSMDFINHD